MLWGFLGKMECKTQCLFRILNNILPTKIILAKWASDQWFALARNFWHSPGRAGECSCHTLSIKIKNNLYLPSAVFIAQVLVGPSKQLKQIFQIPTGRRQTSWLFTSVAEDLNSGYQETNLGHGQSGTWTRDCWITSLTCWPLGQAASTKLIKLEACPEWSPTGVNSNFLTSIHKLFICEVPLSPPGNFPAEKQVASENVTICNLHSLGSSAFSVGTVTKISFNS